MQKEPFIISLSNDSLPNLASDGEDNYGVEFSKTKLWRSEKDDLLPELKDIGRKLDVIIKLLKQK